MYFYYDLCSKSGLFFMRRKCQLDCRLSMLYCYHFFSCYLAALWLTLSQYQRRQPHSLDVTGYLHYKTILCHRVALDVQLMNFFWRKNVSFSRYQEFCVFVKSRRFQNLWCHHKHCWIMEVTHGYFFWILSTIKMKYGQILVCYMKNISNRFLVVCWRLETSFRLLSDFIKMAI